MPKKILIIGGSAAGPKAASKARRLDQEAEITILQKGKFLSMASCGYPYYVGGVFDDRNQLIGTPTGVVRDPSFFSNVKNVNAVIETEALEINRKEKKVLAKNLATDKLEEFYYDKLVIATGATPIKPPIPGINFEGVSTLQSMEDAEYLKQTVKQKKIKKAVVVGAGLIGIETTEALQLAGVEVTVVERQEQILGFLDEEMALLVENHMSTKGSCVEKGKAVIEILGKNGKVSGVKLDSGKEIEAELVVIAIGVKPNVELAQKAGLKIGEKGGISVNHFMQTTDEDIYAAGDCVEITNLVTYEKVNWPMGDAANLQARVVGQNVIQPNIAEYAGAVMTGICKVFAFNVGSSGLTEAQAKRLGYTNIITAIHAAPERPGFMGANPIITKLVADKITGKILGMQSVGPGDVSKRVAIAAMALHAKMSINDLISLDLPYAPPFSQAIDAFITAAHVLENKWLGRMIGISSKQLKEKLDNKETPFILDVRGPDEYEEMRLGIGEKLIPLGMLRKKTGELPKDLSTEIILYCKISLRGYEAACYLKSLGYQNVKVLEGGIIAWPYKREK